EILTPEQMDDLSEGAAYEPLVWESHESLRAKLTEVERERDEAVASRQPDHAILLDAWRDRGEPVPGVPKQGTVQRVIQGIAELKAERDRLAEENARLRGITP